jgi:hypothetical protein
MMDRHLLPKGRAHLAGYAEMVQDMSHSKNLLSLLPRTVIINHTINKSMKDHT